MPISFLRRLLLLLLFMFIVISPSVLATARLLMADHRGGTSPELKLALPEAPLEKISSDDSGHIVANIKQKVPCAMISSSEREVELLQRFEGGNYGSLFLSALPKGAPVPPSGPSRRTNDMNN